MARRRPRGLIREIEDVLVLVKDLDTNGQKVCASMLRSVVRTVEERETMTEEQCRIVRRTRFERRMQETLAEMEAVRRRFRKDE